MQTKRLDHYDLLKAISIFLVIFYHAWTIDVDFLANPTPLVKFHYLTCALPTVSIPLFFFVNGALLIRQKFDLKQHFLKILRFLLLLFIWGFITMCILMPVKGEWFSPFEIFLSIWRLRFHWVNHLWFLGSLITIYLVYPLIKVTFDHDRRVFLVCTGIVCLLVFGNTLLQMLSAIPYRILRGSFDYFTGNFGGMFNPLRGLHDSTFAFFFLGCLLGGNEDRVREFAGRIPHRKLLLCAVIIVSMLLLSLWGMFISKTQDYWWDCVFNGFSSVFTCAAVLSLYLISLDYRNIGNLPGRTILLISKNTLGIYFIHWIFSEFCRELGITTHPAMNNYLANTLLALVILALSLLISLLLRKIPVLRRLVS